MALKINFELPKDKAGFSKLAQEGVIRFNRMKAAKARYDHLAGKVRENYKFMASNVPEVGKKAALEALKLAQAQELATIASQTSQEREDILDEAKELDRIAQKYVGHLGDPRIAASMYGMGSEERARYNAELENAGPAVVREAAVRAEIIGDLHLAAAAWRRSQDLPRNLRPLREDFIEKMFGAMTQGIHEYAKVVNVHLEHCLEAQRQITGETLNGTGKIARSLNHPDTKFNVYETELDDAGGIVPKSSTEKIAAGLAEI